MCQKILKIGLIMKLLITTLTMIFIGFSAQAYKIDDMNKHCKIFKANKFEVESSDNRIMNASIACSHYFRAILDGGQINCHALKMLKGIKDFNRSLLASINANAAVTLPQAINSFLDWAENNEDKWHEGLMVYKTVFLHDKFPCKLKE